MATCETCIHYRHDPHLTIVNGGDCEIKLPPWAMSLSDRCFRIVRATDSCDLWTQQDTEEENG